MTTHATQHESDLRSRIAAASLPSLPQILHQLLDLCQSEGVGIKALRQLVAQDPAMTAKMLSVANSGAFSHGTATANLDQALQTIGTDMIKLIVINESVAQMLGKLSSVLDIDLRSFWTHALQAAAAARIVAQTNGYSNPEEAYLGGLLHDIGRLVLFAIAPREYRVNFFANDDADLCIVEERTLQADHAEVGAWLVEHWKLDSFLADSVRYHHQPSLRLRDAHPLIRITHVAHCLADATFADDELDHILMQCQLKLSSLATVKTQIAEYLQTAAQTMHVDLDPKVTMAAPATTPQDPVQMKIIEQVHGMILNSSLERSFAQQADRVALLEAVARSARVLFQFNSAAVLLMDAAGTALVGSGCGEHSNRLADFVLQLDTEGSTIAAAARSCSIEFSPLLTPAMVVAEQQLLRLFATEQIAALPLVADDKCLGVLIGGFRNWQLEDLQRRMRFLTAFSHQAALALQNQARYKEQTERQIESLSRGFRAASLKMAHEVNNPLSIIRNYLSVLDRKLMKQQPVSADLAILNEEIERVGKIIDEFAELAPEQMVLNTDLGLVVADVVRLFDNIDHGAGRLRIENRLPDRRCEIETSPDTLKQILVNLIKNAIEAMHGSGLVQVGGGELVSREGVQYRDLWVRDNGPGIAPDLQQQLFSPVQSSKGKGHRGLGLHIVHELVSKQGGTVSCRSNSAGTTFEILLPATSSSEAGAVTAETNA